MTQLENLFETSSSSASMHSTPTQVFYSAPSDINSFSNLDRFLRVATPKSLQDFDQVSIFGLRVQLTHESSNLQEIHTYLPSLSSIYLSWKDGFFEYHEEELMYNRLPISVKLKKILPSELKSVNPSSYISVLWTCQRGSDFTQFLLISSLVSG